jgi:hypothetical protein
VKLFRLSSLFGLICLLIWVGAVAVTHVMVWHDVRAFLLEHPEARLAPKPLTDVKIDDLKDGAAIEQYGCALRVPWAMVLDQKKMKSMMLVTFVDGGTVMMSDPASSAELFGLTLGKTAQEKANMQTLYGLRALSSNYELTSAQMQETGAEVSLLHSTMKNTRAMMLLMLKPTYSKATVIYSLSAGRLHGFQIGDPATPIQLLLFDDKDRELHLWIRGPKTGPALTQEQVNGIVASVQTPV